MEGVVVSFKILSQHLPAGTEENHGNKLVGEVGFRHENHTQDPQHSW